MSTKNTTQSNSSFMQQGIFNPASMNTFNAFQPEYQSNMMDFARNPLQSSFFNNQLGMAQDQNSRYATTQNNTFLQNQMTAGNVGNASAYNQFGLAQNARGLSAANSNSFNNLLLGANQLRFGATQGMGAYRPFQTGQSGSSQSTQTQSQGGLGSWLPQVASLGMGIATGGMSSLLGGAAGAFGSAGSTNFGGLPGGSNNFGSLPLGNMGSSMLLGPGSSGVDYGSTYG